MPAAHNAGWKPAVHRGRGRPVRTTFELSHIRMTALDLEAQTSY